jgi:glycosyltransferase involved in cell wall biosynthesis
MPSQRRYRILYHHRTQALDGQRVHINAIQHSLRQLGHEVVEVSPLPGGETAGGASLPTMRRRLLTALAERTPKGAYELLESGYNLVGYRAMAAAIRRARPDFIYERYSLNTIAGAWVSRRYKLPLLLEVNSPLAREKRANGELLFFRAALRIERRALRSATRVLAVTDVLADMLRESASLAPDRIVVVQNGVDQAALDAGRAARETVRQRLGCGPHDVIFGAVGFFRDWHGIDLLLDGFAALRASGVPARLLLVGDGPATAALQQQASRLGLSQHVTFTGMLPHDVIAQYLAAIDAAVIPRAVPYASPLKLFEYMAAGKAVVAPRQANILEVVTEDLDALCFTPEKSEELLALLLRVARDPALRGSLGAAARNTITAGEFTWIGNARRIIETFEAIGSDSPT